MKYVIIRTKKKCLMPIYYPVLFPDHLVHADFVPKGHMAHSAGFVSLMNGEVKTFGKSDSLGIGPHPADAKHIENYLAFGESLMMLSSGSYET
jgi:hypothetical protein